MPPKQPTPQLPSPSRVYLFFYNVLNVAFWATVLLRGATSALIWASKGHLPLVFNTVYSPYLTRAQSLALLEIAHSLFGLVRAPLLTTVMQVASRIFLVWGVMYPFGGSREGIVGCGYAVNDALVPGPGAKLGDYAFLGCLVAWGVTEVIRYGFFAWQLAGVGVPSWWMWLRYNTFYVLYPLGITSECVLVWLAMGPAGQINELYWWGFLAVLGVYIPGVSLYPVASIC